MQASGYASKDLLPDRAPDSAQSEDDYELAEVRVAKQWQGTDQDIHDMTVLGRVQELRRNFQFVSMVGFGSTLICTWEILITNSLGSSLVNGGTAGLVWSFIILVCGYLLVYASLAEMSSMAPTSGGQYHWVSEFSPKSSQKFLSYLTGWLCATGWQAAITAIAFLAGSIIQGLIVLNYPATYTFERWHGTLLIIAITAFAILFNTVLAKKLPLVEGLILVLHILGLFVIIIPLWVLAPRNNSKAVWTEFTNAGGWNSEGTSFMVGLLSPAVSMLGFDCTVHMSEEIRDAARTLPRSMMWSVTLNAALGFVTIVTLCYTLGNAAEGELTEAGYPFIQLFYNATKSLWATDILVLVLILTLTASCIAEIATASRQLWSFSRDKGLPFSSFLSKVTPGWNIPLNAVGVSMLVTILLSLINIGSTAALNGILSLVTTSLLTSYMLTIGLVLLMRIRRQTLPFRQWSLGRLGLPINIGALCFLIPLYIFAFFPATTPVDDVTMNWGVVMYCGIMIVATGYYIMYGRHTYKPPVTIVRRDIDSERRH